MSLVFSRYHGFLLSTIFQLYGGGQFLLVEETVVPGENQ
jgi:hypothetical protein